MNREGLILSASGPSKAQAEAGVATQHMIGKHFWRWLDGPESHRRAREQLELADRTRSERIFKERSALGLKLAWEFRIIPCEAFPVFLVLVDRIAVDPPNLSPTEEKILDLLVRDLSYREIASVLKSESETIRYRVHQMRHKFGCSTTHGMIAEAVRIGVLKCCRAA